mmetsp:Transcript_4261/g.4874  ORF Transcript_4261/g.4874 Transcript_4261/m.4874 type:complete len:363 (+) Transcript_4261:62-1150(+)
MILLKAAGCLIGESVQIELPSPDIVIDPRPNNDGAGRWRFACTYEHHDDGFIKIARLTRIDNEFGYGPLEFRAYDSTMEVVPLFNTTIYVYFGVDGEKVPSDTTILHIHPSVKVIKKRAFSKRRKIQKCVMHDEVHTIESSAFEKCSSLMIIRLSRGLRHIGRWTFYGCECLEALFLPSNIEEIGFEAFFGCTELRILPIPPHINLTVHRMFLVNACHTLFEIPEIQDYERNEDNTNYNFDMVHQSIIDFHQDLPPLHKVCLDTNVTAQNLYDCIEQHGPLTASMTDHDGMTPLHILAMNPHADLASIMACFNMNAQAAFTFDSRGRMPLDYFLLRSHNLNGHNTVVAALCMMHLDMAIGMK